LPAIACGRWPIHDATTSGVIASAPNATKKAPTRTATTSTCGPWLTNITKPTLKRWPHFPRLVARKCG